MRGIYHRCPGCGKRQWFSTLLRCFDCWEHKLTSDAVTAWREIRKPR